VENIYAEGTNQLIVEGAAVIRHAQDVMELLPANATLEREEKLMLQSSVHAVSSC
jgi:predicted Rossmann fold nucleotide-binding protein DprA/Smf involved in DNA uptake